MLVCSALSANSKKLSAFTWNTVVLKTVFNFNSFIENATESYVCVNWTCSSFWELDSLPTSHERRLPSCQCEADTVCPCRQRGLPRWLRWGWGTRTLHLHHALHLHTDWHQWVDSRLLLVSPGPCPEVTAPQKHHQSAVVTKKSEKKCFLEVLSHPHSHHDCLGPCDSFFLWFKSVSCIKLPCESWRTREDILAGPHNFTVCLIAEVCFRIRVTVSKLAGMLWWDAG